MILTGKQKRHLRALGHGLRPLVQIGKQGVTPTIIAQTAEVLTKHELIKVKLLETSPMARDDAAAALSEATGADVAQILGRTILLYLRNADKPVIVLPKGRPAGADDESEDE